MDPRAGQCAGLQVDNAGAPADSAVIVAAVVCMDIAVRHRAAVHVDGVAMPVEVAELAPVDFTAGDRAARHVDAAAVRRRAGRGCRLTVRDAAVADNALRHVDTSATGIVGIPAGNRHSLQHRSGLRHRNAAALFLEVKDRLSRAGAGQDDIVGEVQGLREQERAGGKANLLARTRRAQRRGNGRLAVRRIQRRHLHQLERQRLVPGRAVRPMGVRVTQADDHGIRPRLDATIVLKNDIALSVLDVGRHRLTGHVLERRIRGDAHDLSVELVGTRRRRRRAAHLAHDIRRHVGQRYAMLVGRRSDRGNPEIAFRRIDELGVARRRARSDILLGDAVLERAAAHLDTPRRRRRRVAVPDDAVLRRATRLREAADPSRVAREHAVVDRAVIGIAVRLVDAGRQGRARVVVNEAVDHRAVFLVNARRGVFRVVVDLRCHERSALQVDDGIAIGAVRISAVVGMDVAVRHRTAVHVDGIAMPIEAPERAAVDFASRDHAARHVDASAAVVEIVDRTARDAAVEHLAIRHIDATAMSRTIGGLLDRHSLQHRSGLRHRNTAALALEVKCRLARTRANEPNVPVELQRGR